MFKIAAMMLLCALFGEGFAGAAELESCCRMGVSMTEKNLVVITGATKGIGLGLVGQFIHCGWRVAGCGRSVKAIQELQNKYGSENLFSVVDIKDDASVAKWAKEVASKMGNPSILINNAALINNPKVLWEIPSAEFTDIMDVGHGEYAAPFYSVDASKRKRSHCQYLFRMGSAWKSNVFALFGRVGQFFTLLRVEICHRRADAIVVSGTARRIGCCNLSPWGKQYRYASKSAPRRSKSISNSRTARGNDRSLYTEYSA